MTKSRQVQASEKYLQSPNAIHLSIISMKNSTAKTILTILSMNMSSSLSWRLMSSKHRERLDAKMRSRMVHSKKGLSTTSWTNCRMAVQDRPRHVLPKNEQQEQLKWSIDKLGTVYLWMFLVFLFTKNLKAIFLLLWPTTNDASLISTELTKNFAFLWISKRKRW